MRRLALLGICFAAKAFCQTPDVTVRAEFLPTYLTSEGSRSSFRWYSRTGEFSLVGIRMTLDSGLRLAVNQRLERIDNDPDKDSLDEYYIERRGEWKIGKQYLPFGSRRILRDSVPAARVDTRLVFDAVPIQLAVCDAGTGRTRGVVARIGDRWGISIATGDHFGIGGPSLNQFRRPEDSPGVGRGHKFALGADYSTTIGTIFVEAEWVSLRNGMTDQDFDRDLSDIRARLPIRGSLATVEVAWSRSWDQAKDYFSIVGRIPVNRKFAWEPYLKFEEAKWKEFGLTARVKV